MVLICKESKVIADERQETQKINFDLQVLASVPFAGREGGEEGRNMYQTLFEKPVLIHIANPGHLPNLQACCKIIP